MKINLHTSHPSAFISSTFIDLKQERDAVANALRESNMNINALDVKPASNNSSRKEILTGIKESDFIILIVGERYGSIIPKITVSNKLSITRWEYVSAVKRLGKHALVYFKQVDSGDSLHYDDPTSPDFKIKKGYLAEFKKELSSAHNPKYFTTPEELAEEVRKALIPTYRSGVKSLININESLTKELEALKLENQRLKTHTPTPEKTNPVLLAGLTKPQPQGLLGGLRDTTSNENRQRDLGLIGYAITQTKNK